MFWPSKKELIHSKVCHPHRGTFMEVFDYIVMGKQNISFKIKNPLPTILPNQIYDTKRGVAVKLHSGEYWHIKEIENTQRREYSSNSCA